MCMCVQHLICSIYIYLLYPNTGISNHSGSTEGGHYLAHCKNYDDGAWYCYNDQRVSLVGSVSSRPHTLDA